MGPDTIFPVSAKNALNGFEWGTRTLKDKSGHSAHQISNTFFQYTSANYVVSRPVARKSALYSRGLGKLAADQKQIHFEAMNRPLV